MSLKIGSFLEKTIFLSLFLLLMLNVSFAQSVLEWRQDIDQIVKDLRQHPDPFGKIGETTFLRKANALKKAIPNLTEEQRVVGAMRLVSLVGDGHTVLEPDNPKFAFWYPIKIYEFTDGVFVTSAHTSAEDLVGAQVLEVAGKSINEVLNAVQELFSAENEFDAKAKVYPFHNAMLMKGLGYADELGELKVKFKLTDGKIIERNLKPNRANNPQFKIDDSTFEWRFRSEMFATPFGNDRDWISAYKNLTAEKFRVIDINRPPHLISRRPYIAHPMPEQNAFYAQFNQVDDTRFVPFVREMLVNVDNLKPRRLILDFRYNFGGDGSKVQEAIHEFVKRKENPPWKELYILTGRKTFSAGVMAIDAFLKNVQCTLIGEPPGSALNLFGDTVSINYPQTKLHLQVSILRHQLSSSDDLSEYVPIDVPAMFSFADYAAGRDPAVDAILRGEEMRSIPIIALTEGGAAARTVYEKRKNQFGKYNWWALPSEISLRRICNQLVEQKRMAEALETCKLNTEINPYIWNTWYNIANLQRNLGLRKEALENYRRVLELDPTNFNGSQLRRILSDGFKPQVIRYGATIAETETALKGLCKKINTRPINPPFLPDVKTKQMQIDCDGFEFLGKPRWTEFVFRDDSLEMVWIMTTAEEETAILKEMNIVAGAPTKRNKDYIAFPDYRFALRLDKPEVLFYSEKLTTHISKWFEK